MTGSKAQRAQDLVSAQTTPEDFAIYQVNRDGRRLHVIVYGLVASAEDAQKAVPALRGDLRGSKGWVRSMRVVQQAARAGL